MGFIYSNAVMDFGNIDLNTVLGLPNATFYNNANIVTDAADYPILALPFVVQDGFVAWSDVPDLEVRLGGYGFTFDINGIATAGRLQAFGLADYDAGFYQIITGVNVSLAALFQAGLTPLDPTDDQALMRQIVAGDDTIICSDIFATDDYVYGGGGKDTIYGNDGADTLFGDAGYDELIGGRQSDWLVGGAGRDILRGGTGADRLRGGTGADTIYGGSDNARDVFIYKSVAETAGDFSNDLIYDFVAGQDVIDLRAIDADINTAGDQAFAFSGTVPTANSLWYVYNSYNQHTYLLGDVDGDTVADLGLEFVGLSSFGAGDCML